MPLKADSKPVERRAGLAEDIAEERASLHRKLAEGLQALPLNRGKN